VLRFRGGGGEFKKFTIILPEQFPDCSLIELNDVESYDHMLDLIEQKTKIPKKFI